MVEWPAVKVTADPKCRPWGMSHIRLGVVDEGVACQIWQPVVAEVGLI